METLRGKRVLVTGASSGVGLATAERLAREGVALVLIARGETALAEAVARAQEHGAVVHAVAADLADHEAASAAVERAIVLLGGLDAVVSNAGAVAFGHFLEVEPADFDRTLAVTFGGAGNVFRAALPALRESRGTIVAVSSMMARMPLPAFSSYAASKHALRGFLNTLSVEEREQRTGVRIAMIDPGPLDTPIYGRATSATGRRPRRLHDAYHPDEIARAVMRALRKPQRERVVGGQSKLTTWLYLAVPAAGERVLVLVDRWYRTGTEPAPSPGSLWTGNDPARRGAGPPARRSGDVPAFARHLLAAGRTALADRKRLLRPVPEER